VTVVALDAIGSVNSDVRSKVLLVVG